MYIVDIHVYSNVFVYYTYWQKRCIYICSLHRLHQHVEIVLNLFFFSLFIYCSFEICQTLSIDVSILSPLIK